MSKRKSRNQPILGSFQFSKIDPYGGVESAEQSATRLHCETILPDPDQPRRLLPDDLHRRLFTGELRPTEVMQQWLARAANPAAPAGLRAAVEGIRQLAATIEHRDLINPITVRQPGADEPTLPVGVNYVIVTGERRWWAHVLLTLEERPVGSGLHPDRIKATIVPTENVRALQLIENVAREDLSVVEKARGMVALREELAAADDEAATWNEVETILGISRSYRTRILKVLKLTPEAIELIAQANLPEKTIRPITENLQEHPELQTTALRQIVAWQQDDEENLSYRRVADYVAALLAQPAAPQRRRSAQSADAADWLQRFRQRVNGTLKLFDALDETQLADAATLLAAADEAALAELRRLRARLDSLLGEE